MQIDWIGADVQLDGEEKSFQVIRNAIWSAPNEKFLLSRSISDFSSTKNCPTDEFAKLRSVSNGPADLDLWLIKAKPSETEWSPDLLSGWHQLKNELDSKSDSFWLANYNESDVDCCEELIRADLL